MPQRENRLRRAGLALIDLLPVLPLSRVRSRLDRRKEDRRVHRSRAVVAVLASPIQLSSGRYHARACLLPSTINTIRAIGDHAEVHREPRPSTATVLGVARDVLFGSSSRAHPSKATGYSV